MQMVNCVKCGKPIDHTHAWQLAPLNHFEHINCDSPVAASHRSDLKSGPVFETKTPNQRQISQHEIYKKS